ncbi:hypothetical protein EC988_004392, partial [Linderina pennispora]
MSNDGKLMRDDAQIAAGGTKRTIGKIIRNEAMVASGNEEMAAARTDKQRIHGDAHSHHSGSTGKSTGDSPEGMIRRATQDIEQGVEAVTDSIVHG